MQNNKKLFSIVIPVMNEQEVLPMAIERIDEVTQQINQNYTTEIIFIDDGSNDATLSILKESVKNHPYIKIISLSRNFGHQIAITAGIQHANGEFVGIIDADLQDPPELFRKILEHAEKGKDIVYGKRISRKGETFFKKITAKLFYRFLNSMTDVELPLDTGDFRIISKRVALKLNSMPEKHRYVRGMIPWIGFESYPFEYIREERAAGETKYPLRKMISFASNAIVSFSSKPLDVAFRFGIISILLGISLFLYLLLLKIFSLVVPGITVIIATIVFLGGIQILFLGLIGKYVAKIFEESKNRPLFIVKEKINF